MQSIREVELQVLRQQNDALRRENERLRVKASAYYELARCRAHWERNNGDSDDEMDHIAAQRHDEWLKRCATQLPHQ